MFISKVSLFRLSAFLLTASVSSLFPVDRVDRPAHCLELTARGACVAAGMIGGMIFCGGGPKAAAVFGGCAAQFLVDEFCSQDENTRAILRFAEPLGEFSRSNSAETCEFMGMLAGRCHLWLEGIEQLLNLWYGPTGKDFGSCVKRFLLDVVPVVIKSEEMSQQIFARALRIAWSYALAQLLADDIAKERVLAFADAEVDYFVDKKRFTREQGGYLKLMGEAYSAYDRSWGRAGEALKILARGKQDTLRNFREIFNSGPLGPQQLHLD